MVPISGCQLPSEHRVLVGIYMYMYACINYLLLRWLEIVSWHARRGSLITCAHASTPGSRRCKFTDLVPLKILQNLYFDRKYL